MSEHPYQYFEGLFEGFQNEILPYQSWRPTFCEQVIVIVHGMGEHSGRYMNLINYFKNQGIAFYGYDHRGHGKSPGKRGHAPSCLHLVEDLARFLKLVSIHEEEKPITLFGHSFGGLIALKYLINLHRKAGFKPDGAVLSNPLIELALEVPAWKVKLAKLMAGIFPKLSFTGTITGEKLTHDPLAAKAYDTDPLVHQKVTAGLYVEMNKPMQKVKDNVEFIDVPILMLLGSSDPVVSPKGGENLFSNLKISDKDLKIYEGYYHELINEIDRERVFQDIERWVQSPKKRAAL